MHKILVVEDESVIRNALRRLLERNGYEVSEAGSVQQAESDHELGQFDLIISDLRLPGAAGTDLIHKAGDVPVLIMTSYASLRSAVDSMRMGAVDYIAKPFDHDDMVSAVQRIIADHPPPGRSGNGTFRAGSRRGAGIYRQLPAWSPCSTTSEGRTHRIHRTGTGGDRYRQGTGGAQRTPAQPALGEDPDFSELRRHPGHPDRVGTVRL